MPPKKAAKPAKVADEQEPVKQASKRTGLRRGATVDETAEEPVVEKKRGRKPKGVIEEEPKETKKQEDLESDDSKDPEEAKEEVKNGNVKKAKGGRKPKAESKEDKEEVSKPEKKAVKRKGKVDEVTDEAKDENETVNPEKRTRKKPQEDEIEEKKDEEKAPKRKGRQPKAKPEKAAKTEDEEKPKKRAGREKKEKEDKPKNKTGTDWETFHSTCDKKNELGEEFNFKVTSWNVSGIRAWLKKGGLDILEHDKPDILCLQEIKCSTDKLPEEVQTIDGYNLYWCNSDKEGYAGVALFSKIKPINVTNGIGNEEHDKEGRIITAEFEKFYVVSVYVPNAGRGLVTLPKRLEWNKDFKQYIKDLDSKKPVIIAGDMNVAHNEIDLANPKSNVKNAGFTPQEREGMTDFLSEGFVDTFRELYPELKDKYTFWTYMANARAKNVGWRLDYFITSKRLMKNICDNVIHDDVFGSDHCPLTLFINV